MYVTNYILIYTQQLMCESSWFGWKLKWIRFDKHLDLGVSLDLIFS